METLTIVSCIVTSLMLLLGIPGNALVTLIWSRKNGYIRNPYAASLALLDVLVTLSGPATILVTVTFGSDWLANHVGACDAIGFLNTYALLGSAVALLFLVEYSRHAQNFSILRDRRKSKKHLIIGITWLLPLATSLPPLLGWGSFKFDSSLGLCVFYADSLRPAENGHVYCFLLAYFLFSLITCLLSGHHSRRLQYAAQVNWKVHMLEMKMNDPECTTAHSTSSTLWSERHSIPNLDRSQVWIQCPAAEPRKRPIESLPLDVQDTGRDEHGEGRNGNESGEQRGKEEKGKRKDTSGEEGAVMKVAIQEEADEPNEQQQAPSQENGKVKELEEKRPGNEDQDQDGESRERNLMAHATPEGKVSNQQSGEQERCDPTTANPTATGHRQRFVPTPLTLPTQGMLQEFDRRPVCKKLQSPRFLHSPVVNRSQREMTTLVLVTALVSLIGCLPYIILHVLTLVSIRCPEILWTLATLLLYVRSAITPVAYWFYISDYREGFGREFSKCCFCHTASGYEGRGTASQEDMQNHVASDPPNVICRSFSYVSHTRSL